MSLAGGYDFSNLFHASITAYSPGSTFLATAHLRRIIIRSTASLSIVRTFQCLGGRSAASSSRHTDNVTIDQLSWSADSLYVMAYSSKASTAWIFGLTDEGNGEGGEVARIGGEGPEGLVKVEWGRGGREVLAWSDFGVRLPVCKKAIPMLNADTPDGMGSRNRAWMLHPAPEIYQWYVREVRCRRRCQSQLTRTLPMRVIWLSPSGTG